MGAGIGIYVTVSCPGNRKVRALNAKLVVPSTYKKVSCICKALSIADDWVTSDDKVDKPKATTRNQNLFRLET